MRSALIVVLVMVIAVPPAGAQSAAAPEVWRTFAQKVEVGSRIKVRLREGPRVTATMIQAAPDYLLVQPVTRVPVPVQQVAYDQIVSIERDDSRGIGAAKAAAIGVAAGVGAFFGVLLIFLVAASD